MLVTYLELMDLLDQKKENVDNKENIDFDFILFSNFSNELMFKVMDELREAKASVQHKAGLQKII